MKTTREQFEEIWPVPNGVGWGEATNCYFAWYHMAQEDAIAHTARLDTFTRCQETTSIHLSLIDELVQEIESCHADLRKENWYVSRQSVLLGRAKQILGREK